VIRRLPDRRARARAVLLFLGAVAMAARPQVAAAQTGQTTASTPVTRGADAGGPSVLSGRGGLDRRLGQELVIDVNASGGSDRLSGESLDATSARTSSFATGSLLGAYSLNRDWLSAGAHGGTNTRYFAERTNRTESTLFGGIDAALEVPLSGRTRVSGWTSISSQPASALTLFSGMFSNTGPTLIPSDFDLGVSLGRQTDIQADIRAHRMISRRAELSADVAWSRVEGAFDLGRHQHIRGEARYRQSITRNLSIHLGYGRDRGVRAATATEAESVVVQDTIDVGVDFGLSRTLTISRRLSFSFNTGSILMSDGRYRRFEVVGDASLNYRVGRQWSSDVVYSRGVSYAASFSAPTFADNVASSVQGRLGSRVGLTGRAGLSSGHVGLTDTRNGYLATQAGADISLDVAGPVSLTSGYTYYRYRFDGTPLLVGGYGSDLRRHTVFFGASVSLSLIGSRSRGTYAAR
jgi:hypothetical protein